MIEIDGSLGEGGGQVLRTSLSLSMTTGKPFKIINIRANRRKPGLMRQHLTAVKAAREICGASVVGSEASSQELIFEPGDISGGTYEFAIGTAGSTTLVLQTILPALMNAAKESSIKISGGTHNQGSPPFDFLKSAFASVVEKMGPKIVLGISKYGFYPVGGGEITVGVIPSEKLEPVEFVGRGAIGSISAKGYISNLSVDIATRELSVVKKRLKLSDEDVKLFEPKSSSGPGNALVVEVSSDGVTEVFTEFGERGVSAERVAERVCHQVSEYISSEAPIGRYLADQIMLPMAIAGSGKFLTMKPSRHMTTNKEVIQKFLPVEISVSQESDLIWQVQVSS